ncbi:MAG: TetR/AcrR family transcriptional regulator [Pseudonocardia sp.]|nr:TetR/AcrR family transcriptional regulator [Pseudonocardia sp.]
MSRIDAHRNRARILASAAKKLRANPAATLEQIIAGTGLGRTTVYRHFPTRADLVEAVAVHLIDVASGLLDQARPDEGPFRAAFARMTDTAVDVGTGMWGLLSQAGQDTIASSRPAARIEAAVRALLQRGVDEGDLRADVPLDWHVEAYFALAGAVVRLGDGDARVLREVFLNGLSAR